MLLALKHILSYISNVITCRQNSHFNTESDKPPDYTHIASGNKLHNGVSLNQDI